MKKNIYLYLQRYLLKVLTKSWTYNSYNSSVLSYTFNTITPNPIYLLTWNFLKKRDLKQGIALNCDFSVISSLYLINQTVFLKQSKRHCFFVFSFGGCASASSKLSRMRRHSLQNINFNDICAIKSSTFSNEAESLYKEKFGGNFSSFQLLPKEQIKKGHLVSRPLVCYKYVIFLTIHYKKNQNSFNFRERAETRKIKALGFSSLKSFFNLSFFLSQQFSVNKKSESVHLSKLFYIAFPFEILSKDFSTKTTLSPLLDKTLTVLAILFLLALKYVIKKKLIQNPDYKAFGYLVNTLDVYQFLKKNPPKIEIKSFQSQKGVINTVDNSSFCLMRPFFALTRLDTFYICESLRLPLYPDQSNFRVDFLRNRIRKQILPAIRILLNPQFDTILCKFNEF